jgi:hypothetical protein
MSAKCRGLGVGTIFSALDVGVGSYRMPTLATAPQSDTKCEKRPLESQWRVPGDLLVCYRCGSIWSLAMMGDWIPLSCVERTGRGCI